MTELIDTNEDGFLAADRYKGYPTTEVIRAES